MTLTDVHRTEKKEAKKYCRKQFPGFCPNRNQHQLFIMALCLCERELQLSCDRQSFGILSTAPKTVFSLHFALI